MWTQAARAYNTTVDRGRHTGPRLSNARKNGRTTAAEPKSVITKHAHGTAQQAQEYHGTGARARRANSRETQQQYHSTKNSPDGHNHEAHVRSDPAFDSPCCRSTQPSGRPCSPCSTAQRGTGRDQDGEPRQAMTGSTGTQPPQHIQTAWGKAGSTRYKTYHVRPFPHDIKPYGKRRQHSRAEGVPSS